MELDSRPIQANYLELDSRPIQANYCTVELKTGNFVAIAATPEQVLGAVVRAKEEAREAGGDGYLALPRMANVGRSDSNYRAAIWLPFFSISAIYPLDEHPVQLRDATRARPSEVT